MKYAHIINYFNSAPWAILPDKLDAILSIIELRCGGGLRLSEAEIESRIGPRQQRQTNAPTSVALLPIHGTIAHRAGLLQQASGGMSVEGFTQDFRAAVRDPDVGAIVLDIDSPGGSTAGIQELSDEIHAARGQKRILASVNALGASAAYWLASSAHEIAVTPSGHVGSIGVLGVHMDASAQAEAAGVKVTLVSAGKHKAEASEFTPLTAGAEAHLQSIVDDRYTAFVNAVARGRRVSQKAVRNGFGEGRLVTATEAVKQGMADSVETMDSVVSRAAKMATRGRGTTAQVTTLDTFELPAVDAETVTLETLAVERPEPGMDPAMVALELLELEG